MEPASVLFLHQPSMGHLNTLMTMALQMKEDGHDVRFLIPGRRGGGLNIQILNTASNVIKTIESNQLRVDLMTPALSTILPAIMLSQTQGYKELVTALDMFSRGLTHYARKILADLDRERPDVLVADFAFPAALIAAEVKKIPCVAIYHSGLPFRGKNIPPFGSGLPIVENYAALGPDYVREERDVLRKYDARVNSARASLGLNSPLADTVRSPCSPWLNLATTVEVIEAPRDNLTANCLFIGPCFSKRKKGTGGTFPFDRLLNDKYKVYVSLGTVFNNRPDVFHKIITALSGPEFLVVISAGGAYEALRRRKYPDNILLFPSVPQVDLLPLVDLVIGHGGNNTTNETLAAGKPLIIMPVGGEQGDNASRIEYLRVGLHIDINRFDEREILQKVNQIKNQPAISARARELRDAIACTDGPRTASACIAWVAESQKPLCRPAGWPLTITKDNLKKLLCAE